jgi:hypothetical protein
MSKNYADLVKANKNNSNYFESKKNFLVKKKSSQWARDTDT